MYDYGEACPISKATSVLCERWTVQIIREMLLGAKRFSEIQKMLPKISPSLLNARLKFLCENGIIIRKRIPEQRGYEYHLTPAGESLYPVVMEIGKWGMRWIYAELEEEEHDLTILMGHIAAMLKVDELPSCDSVIQITFTDLAENSQWFLFVNQSKCEVCDENRGYEVDVYLRSTLQTLSDIWWNNLSFKEAIATGELQVVGAPVYAKTLSKWFPTSMFADDNSVRKKAKQVLRPESARPSC